MAFYRGMLIRSLVAGGEGVHGSGCRRIFGRGIREVAMSQAALDAAAERRRRKRKLRLEPPSTALQRNRDRNPVYGRGQQDTKNNVAEHRSVLVGDRLALHNRIEALCCAGNLEEAMLGIRHSIFSNCRPTVFTCNSVLDHLHRAARHGDVLSTFKFIAHSGIVPNLDTYNIVLGTHCKKLDMDAASNMLSTIHAAEMKPNTVTFNHLMTAHFGLKNYEQVMKLLREMLENCQGADPQMYAAAIEGFVNAGAMDRATEICNEMRQRDSTLTEPVLCNLVKGYFAAGRVSDAVRVFRVFESSGEKDGSTAVLYNVLLDAYLREGMSAEMCEVIDEMVAKRCEPNTVTYSLLIDGLKGKVDECWRVVVVKLMEAGGFRPTLEVYNKLFGLLCKEGKLDQARGLFYGMVDGGQSPDVATYDVLMEGFGKQGDIGDGNEVRRLFQPLLEKGDLSEELVAHLLVEETQEPSCKLKH